MTDFELEIENLTKEFEADSRLLAQQIENEAGDIESSGDVLEDNGTLLKIKYGEYTYNFEWKEVSFDVPYPEIATKENSITIPVPQVTMNTREIKFEVPYVKMVDKKVAEKPETKCKWEIDWILGVKTKAWKCTTKMNPIIVSVPEVHKRTERVVIKIPNVTVKDELIKFNVPSITVQMKRVLFHSLVPTSVDYDATEDEIDKSQENIQRLQTKLNARSMAFNNQLNEITKAEINEQFDKAIATVEGMYKPIEADYLEAIAGSKDALKRLKAVNASEAIKQEEQKINTIIENMKTAIAPYESMIVTINSDRKTALAKLER